MLKSLSVLLRRLGAIAYDSLICLVLLIIATIIILLFNNMHSIAPGNLGYTCYLVAIIFSYFCGSWLYGGQTIGMRAWGLKLRQHNNQPPTIWHACARFGFAIPSLLLGGLGLWWILIDKHQRSWHDYWSKTKIVHIKDPAKNY